MGNLLEFKPLDKFLRIGEALEENYFEGYTPDMPALRFDGVQRVFLWDELKSWDVRKKIGLEMQHHHVTGYNMRTVNQYVPFYDKAKQMTVLPANKQWPAMIDKEQLKDFPVKSLQPRPLLGRIAEVNLEGMRILDTYYVNSLSTHRIKVFIGNNQGYRQPAWIYLRLNNQLGKYDPHTKVTKIHKHIKAAPVQHFTNDSCWDIRT